MKKYILLLFLGINIALHAQYCLDIHYVCKEQTKWCGIASTKCALDHYGLNQYRQCDLAEYDRTNCPWGNNGFYNCCAFPGDCNLPTELLCMSDIFTHLVKIHNNIGDKPADIEYGIRWHLQFDRPLIMRWENTNDPSQGHAMVIYGVDDDVDNTIDYMDPDTWPYGGLLRLPYEDLKCLAYSQNVTYEWRQTIYLLDSPSEPPPPPPPPADKCSNCKKDNGEVKIDCGGPNCRPCDDLPKEKVLDSSSNIPSEVMALKKITAKSATISSGKEVSFMTTDTGTIILLPNFKANAGSEFRAYTKELTSYTRACNDYCHTAYLYDKLSRKYDNLLIYDLCSAVRIEYEIRNKDEKFIYGNAFDITSTGSFNLWDLKAGAIDTTGRVVYNLNYSIHFCWGVKYNYKHKFIVRDLKVNHSPPNDDSEEEDNIVSSQSSNSSTPKIHDGIMTPEFSILPNPNPGTFQLETNFPLSDIDNLKITNTVGAMVYESQHLISNEIQLQNSSTGLYFVVMVLKDGTVLTQKVMIRR